MGKKPFSVIGMVQQGQSRRQQTAADFNSNNYGYTNVWANWDKNAATDLGEISTLVSQLTSGGATLDPTLTQLRNQMASAVASGNTEKAQQARLAYVTALRKASQTQQQQAAQAQVGQNEVPQQFQAPGQEGAPPLVSGQLGEAAVPTTDDSALISWLTAQGQTAQPGAPATTTVTADVNKPEDRQASWQTTAPPITPVPETNIDTAPVGEVPLTTGAGQITDMNLPGYQAPEQAAVPEAKAVTPGYEQQIFSQQIGDLLKTGNADLDATLQNLVTSQNTKGLEEMLTAYLSVESGNDPDQLTDAQQKYLDNALEKARAAAKEIAAMGIAQLATGGLGKSSQVVDFTGATAVKLARDLAGTELEYRVGVGEANRVRRQEDMKTTLAYIQAIQANDTQKMSTILTVRADELNRSLSEQELQAKYDIMRENQNLLRDEFTEEQRKALKAEGWKDEEIAMAEQEMRWRQAYEEQQFVANHNLAVRNTDIAEQFRAKELAIEEKDRLGRLTLDEIKNKWDMSFSSRVQSLAEELGLRGAEIDEEQMDYMWDRMQKEFGMDINRFALEQWVATGNFNLEVLNSQRSYDLSVTEQQNEWAISKAGLQVQETLGLTETALKDLLSGREISLEQDKMYTMKFLELLGISTQVNETELNRELERWHTKTEINAQKEGQKNSFVSSLVSSAVKTGIGFAAGGPPGALAVNIPAAGTTNRME